MTEKSRCEIVGEKSSEGRKTILQASLQLFLFSTFRRQAQKSSKNNTSTSIYALLLHLQSIPDRMKSLRPPTPLYILALFSALSIADSNECRIVIAQNEWAAGCKPIRSIRVYSHSSSSTSHVSGVYFCFLFL